jgi:hypothetical protein
MDILYELPVSIKIVTGLTTVQADAKRAKGTLSERVQNDKEIEYVIQAINNSLDVAKKANKRHQAVVLKIKELELKNQAVKKDLMLASTDMLRLRAKDTASEDELNKAREELLKCNGKLEESNKKLEKLKELEDLVDKQKKEIEILSKLAEKTAKTAKSRRLGHEDKIEKLQNEAYKLEVKHKKEFDAKVEEFDDLRAKFKGLEISLRKQEAKTSLRTTEKNELNAGLINAKKEIKKKKVEISSLKSTIKSKDKEIIDEVKQVKELEQKETAANAAISEAGLRVNKAEQAAALAEKKRVQMEKKYLSAKKRMAQMQKDEIACINPEPKNQPILAGKAKEPTEFLGYWIKGPGEGLHHPHDFKNMIGGWKDTTTPEKLQTFARLEGRWEGIRRVIIDKKSPNTNIAKETAKIFGVEDIQENQAKEYQKGRKANYITTDDQYFATLYSKAITFINDKELEKLYNELKQEGTKAAQNSFKSQGKSLLNNIQLKF